MNKKVILMLGTDFMTPGGMTSVIQTYADHGAFEAWNVRYISSYKVPSKWVQLRVMLCALWQTFCLLVRGRVALMHVHSASRGSFWRKSLFCGMALLFRVPYVFHVHCGEFPLFYETKCGTWAKVWVRRTLRKAARVIALTPSWCEPLIKIEPAARITVVGNPVYVPEAMATLRVPAKVVLFLARLREKKGVFDLVRAIPFVLKVVPDVLFVLAGDGELEAVEALAETLGVRHAIRLPGWVDGDEKLRLLSEADAFVLPSYFEGLPVGLLEAMAYGVPIVTTPVGGIPDLIQHRKNGLLVQASQPDALAQAIIEILTEEKLRIFLREAAFQRVLKVYSIRAALGALQKMYVELGVPVASIKGFGNYD